MKRIFCFAGTFAPFSSDGSQPEWPGRSDLSRRLETLKAKKHTDEDCEQ